MKTLALLSALFVSLSAQARTPIFHQTEILPNVVINGEETRHTAVVNIDMNKKTIKAEIFDDICSSLTAPEGAITCMAMPRLVTTIEAPITERGTSCGSSIYKAAKDDSIRDGLRTDIKVSDHRGRVCKDLVRSIYEVEASVFNPWTQKTTEYYLSK
jgi:hypothetical protein